MTERFLQLMSALVRENTRTYESSKAFVLEQDKERWRAENRTAILREIWKIRSYEPALSFLTAVNISGCPDELSSALLNRAGRIAAQWLPTLTNRAQSLASETEMTKFQRRQNDNDPFLDAETNLTRDAYSGQVPADDLDYSLDSRGNIVNK